MYRDNMYIRIYQIKDIKNCNYAFRDYKESLFNINDYEVKYEGNYNKAVDGMKDATLLEMIYRDFNVVNQDDVDRLKTLNYQGHSLSVSDVVELDNRKYYCNCFGWKRLE